MDSRWIDRFECWPDCGSKFIALAPRTTTLHRTFPVCLFSESVCPVASRSSRLPKSPRRCWPNGPSSTALLDSDEHRPYRGGRRFHGRHRHGHASGRAESVLEASTSTHPLAEDRTKAGPRVLSLLQRETAVPVPTVFDTCYEHDTYPTPFPGGVRRQRDDRCR